MHAYMHIHTYIHAHIFDCFYCRHVHSIQWSYHRTKIHNLAINVIKKIVSSFSLRHIGRSLFLFTKQYSFKRCLLFSDICSRTTDVSFPQGKCIVCNVLEHDH